MSMMRKVAWMVLVVVMVGGYYVAANAQTESRSALTQLRKRVTTLEIRADRQRRAIVDLRNENAAQGAKLANHDERLVVLENFRNNTNAWIVILDKRTADLDAQGDYAGPVRANQVGSASCFAVDAVWNASGGLDCPAAP
jgi:uncharacterized coiled-coil protein SlyX